MTEKDNTNSQAPGTRDGKPELPPRDKRGEEDVIFDKRAAILGLIVCACLAAFAVIWKLTPTIAETLKRSEEFQFSVTEHQVEDFKLKDPMVDIMKERIQETPETIEEIEAPNIQISTAPEKVAVEQFVVQSRNVDVETPKIEISAVEAQIQDSPLEISQVADVVTYAIMPIAADTLGAADIFKYKEPAPPDRPRAFMINQGPRPGQNLKMLPKAFGDQDAPTMGQLGPANINLFGTSDFFRTMERAGGVKAKASVDAALHWLFLHQGPDGLWEADKYEGKPDATLAVTALATLAMMSGGHTTRKGEYRRSVLKGLEAIMKCQQGNGHMSWRGANLYTHAICTIALCEAYGRAHDENIGAAAQKAVNFCESAVNADGGWRYVPKADASDMSVTAWFLQALKTARLAQLKYDNSIFSQGQTFLDSATDKGASKDSIGTVTYQYQASQNYPQNNNPALTCAGMLVRQFTGMGVKNHILLKGAELTKAKPPDWKAKDFYYWYYATYAMHNMGEENRLWWNQRIRDTLLEHQGRDGDNAGSWDPKGDKWGDQRAGRVYTTSLGALCLEVYYRYSEALTSFGVAPDLDELFLE